MKNNWQKSHKEVITSFLKYLNSQTSEYILKGGTALLICYGLDRFSEDIDLDGQSGSISNILDEFCKKRNFIYRTAKDTETVKRYMINYGNTMKPLKVEISFRKKHIEPNEINFINGVKVYNIENLCIMKSNAYSGRDKIRDLYDLSFICNNYWDSLSSQTKAIVRNTLEYKGIEQFDYLIQTSEDDLIDKNKLADDFLRMYDMADLLYSEEERKNLLEIPRNLCSNNEENLEI